MKINTLEASFEPGDWDERYGQTGAVVLSFAGTEITRWELKGIYIPDTEAEDDLVARTAAGKLRELFTDHTT